MRKDFDEGFETVDFWGDQDREEERLREEEAEEEEIGIDYADMLSGD